MTNFIFGFLVMSFFSCIAVTAADNGNGSPAIFFSGPCGWVFWLFLNLFHLVKDGVKEHVYHTMLLCSNGRIYHTSVRRAKKILEHTGYGIAPYYLIVGQHGVIADDWPKKHRIDPSVPNTRYTPHRVYRHYEAISFSTYLHITRHTEMIDE